MQTIGERLEDGRKRKGISIREAAEATKIRGDYLQKFENNQFDIGLTDLYVRGFLRSYATFLKLPAERILNDFASLGRAEPRPRQPSRESYGRMDVSVASVEEAAERGNAPDAAAVAESTRAPHRVPRSPGSSLPNLPSINPTVIFRGGIAIACVLAIVVIIWIGKALFGGNSKVSSEDRSSAPAAQQQPAAATKTFTLVATGPVQVTVNVQNPNKSVGDEIYSGSLGAGQSQAVAWTSDVYITANPAENLVIEVNGKRWPTGYKGNQMMGLPLPK